MNKLLVFAEKGFTVAVLLVYSGAILLLLLSGGAQENEFVEFDSSLIRIINFLIYIVTFLLLGLRWKNTLYFLSKDRWLFLLVVLAAISMLWSFEKGTTLKDSITLIGSSLFGLYFASRYTLKQQLNLLGWTYGIIVVLSFIFAVALPKYGIMGGIHQGKWRGVFLHKNGLGARMVYSCMVFLILAYQSKKHSLLMWIGFSLSILLILMAASSSSLLNILILALVYFIFQNLRLPYLLMLPMLTMILTLGQILYFWFINNASVVFASIGKDATLTGRTELWPLVMDMIWKHPWIGYGYGGFWQGWDGESAYIWRGSGWTPTHPHNGFLALWLDLGLLGLGIFLLGFRRSLLQSLYWVRITSQSVDLYPLLHTSFLIIANLTETNLLETNSLTWILYISSSIYISEAIDRQQTTGNKEIRGVDM
ncbi:O-antigen ligase [Anabaena sp. UHCC 0204]|uniref:O-antigen ligase family protein n=2 Tax=unclassified Anabaena TaxID=2619674 RepID=UPI0014452AAA|nr:O-antigen ligase family protein [Anabaena sp. UHCC 0204]MTJ08756.1 O-antigen ligase family protein [Anabaena sp. UHCC 0204]